MQTLYVTAVGEAFRRHPRRKGVFPWQSVKPPRPQLSRRNTSESRLTYCRIRPVESRARSIVKAVSYRVLGSITTGLIVYVITGRGGLSLGAGGLDMVAKIVVYFVHERIWDRIAFGRVEKPPEYEI